MQAPQEGGAAGPSSRGPQESRGHESQGKKWNRQVCTQFLLL